MFFQELADSVAPPSEAAREAAWRRLDSLTKPPRSLGRLEEWVARYCAIAGRTPPPPLRPAAVVFAADHGVAEEGVSAYPREVTAQMVMNFLGGGAAVNALAREAGAELFVVDVGVAADLPPHERLLDRKVGRGTRNLLQGPAMTAEEAERALRAGADVARERAAGGATALALGEMGIGNTTSAAALSAALLDAPAADLVGPGTGVEGEALERKRRVVERALARCRAAGPNRAAGGDAFGMLCELGGFEIAALAGAILGGAAARLALFVDGFVVSAAALLAARLCPAALAYCFPSHLSAEPGHRRQAEGLGWDPPLRMEMRLGEGTGALLALGMLRGGLRAFGEMSTFEEAGVGGGADPGGGGDPGGRADPEEEEGGGA